MKRDPALPDSELGDTLVSAVRPAGSRWTDLTLGDELSNGRFVIERVLGKGGMGVVYEARDLARGTRVALKTLHLTAAPAIHAIKHEFRSLADTQHPGLVRLHELFWEDGRCYFTMDLVRGKDFLTHVRTRDGRAPLSRDANPTLPAADGEAPASSRYVDPASIVDEARVRSCLAQLVEAVDALHRQGKVHRDLKPSNVLVDEAGKLLILDFGLVLDESRDAIRGMAVAGTPLYMAPELFRGSPASPESDWYAVGVMLYQALTGRDPFYELGQFLIEEKRTTDPTPVLEIAPGVSPALAELAEKLLHRTAAERPRASDLRRALGVLPVPSAPVSPKALRLFGRERELRELERAFEELEAKRQPLLVTVTGSSGIGKSALLEHFASKVRLRAQVLFGRCHEREWVPHKAFDEIVEALSRRLLELPEAAVAELLPEDTSALVSVFPVLAEIPLLKARSGERPLVNPRELRRRAYQSLTTLFARVAAARSTVVIIDDLHWGDVDSARLLLDLLGAAEPPACLFIVSYREEERRASACLAHLFERERRLDERVERWELAVTELPLEESRALATSLMGEGGAAHPELLAAVCAEANGNPLLLRELSSHAGSEGVAEGEPQLDLRRVVRARLARLTPEARRLFELVCVSGSPLSPTIAAHALEGGVSEAVTSLHGERLVRERTSLRPDTIDVFHDRIRVATLQELPSGELRERHLALALAREEAGAEEPEAMARHYAGAGQREKASTWAERAASESTALLALNRAAELYRLAYELGDSSERKQTLRIKLARALSDAGRGGEAAPLFLEAAADASVSESLELRRRAAEQFLVSGRTAEGLRVLAGVLEEVGLSLPRTPRAALWDLALTRTRLSLRGLGFEPRPADKIDPKQLLRADACKASWALGFVNTIQGAAFQARFLQEALKSGEPCRIALGLGMEAIYRSTEGQVNEPRVRELQEAARNLGRALDDPHVRAFEHLVQGQSSYLFGRWREAADALEQTERILVERCRNVTWELNSSRFFWGNSLVHLGRWQELAKRLDVWTQDAADRGDLYAQASLNLIRARTLLLAADDPGRAEQQVDASLAMWRSSEFGVQQFLAEVSRVQIALYRGDTALAVEYAERIWPAFSSSLMQRIQLCRIHMYHHTSYALLSHAYRTGELGSLKRIAGYAQKLENEATPWAMAFALQIRACLLDLGRDSRGAREAQERAEGALDALGMSVYAAACRARRGQALGESDEGRMLWASARARLSALGILRPERVVAMMSPGKD